MGTDHADDVSRPTDAAAWEAASTGGVDLRHRFQDNRAHGYVRQLREGLDEDIGGTQREAISTTARLQSQLDLSCTSSW